MNGMAKMGVVAFLFTISTAMGVWALFLGAARSDAKRDGSMHLPQSRWNIAYREAGDPAKSSFPPIYTVFTMNWLRLRLTDLQ